MPLKVKALSQTLRDAGLSPAWHYTFCLYEFTLRENYLFIKKTKILEYTCLQAALISIKTHSLFCPYFEA